MSNKNQTPPRLLQHHHKQKYQTSDDFESFVDNFGSSVHQPLLVLDPSLRVFSANHAFCDLLKIDHETAKGCPLFELGDRTLDIPEFRRFVEGVVLDREPVNDFELSLSAHGGRVRSMLVSARTLNREHQRKLTLLTMEEITEPAIAPAATWEDQSLLSIMIENAPVALAMFDRQMRYVVASRRWIVDYHLPRGEIRGRSHYEILPEISDEWKHIHLRGMAGEHLRSDEDRFVRRDGSVQWLRWDVRPWYSTNGRVGGIVIFTEDLNALKCAASAALDNHERLMAALESMSDAVFISDASGRFVEVNQAFMKFHRFRDRDELFATQADYQSVLEFSFPNGTIAPLEMWPVARALRGENVIDAEYRLRRKDTGEAWIASYNFSPIRDESDVIVGTIVVGRDITNQVSANLALRNARAELEVGVHGLARLNETSSILWRTRNLETGLLEILRSTVDIMSADFGTVQLLDPDRQVLTIAAQQGFSEENLDALREVIVNDASACSRALHAQQRLFIEDVECDEDYDRFRELEYRSCYRAVQATPLLSPDGDSLGMVSTYWRVPHRPSDQELAHLDLFARQTAEFIWRHQMDQQLRYQEAVVESILSTAADAIINLSQQNVIVRANKASETMFGYTQLELVGRNIGSIIPNLTTKELDSILNRCKHVSTLVPASPRHELLGRRLNNTSFPLEISVSEVDHLGLYTVIARDISDRYNLQREVITVAEDEQRRIGQELHDSAQQELTAVSLLARVLLERFQSESLAKTGVDIKKCADVANKILSGIKRAHQEIRQVSHGLIPFQLDSDSLVCALQDLAIQSDAPDYVSCTFACKTSAKVADSFTATHLFRIAQEAVTNCLKHAGAKHIGIELNADGRDIELRVTDDGRGVNDQKLCSGMGMKSMEYRAHLINGILKLTNLESGGTCLTCTVFAKQPGVDAK